MNGKNIKTIIICICVGIFIAVALFSGGIFVGTRIANGNSGGTDLPASADLQSINSRLSELNAENERLKSERDEYIEQLNVSNGKLDAISAELQQCSKDIASQSAEYSERITKSNNDVLEYSTIVTERVLKLCDRMEESISIIATECGVDYSRTE